MQQLNSVGILLHNLTGEAILTKGCTVQPGEFFVATELVGRNLQANYGELLPEINFETFSLESLQVFTAYTKETLELALNTVLEDEENEPESEPAAVTGQGEEDQVDSQEADAEITLDDIPPVELPPLEDEVETPDEVTEPEEVTPDAPRRGRPPKNNS